MRKIDLSDYQTAEGQTFHVRSSLVAALFNEKNLDAREIIRRDELAQKIETYAGDSILIEEADYLKFVAGLKATDLQPYGRSVVEFLKRVLDAAKVDVVEQS